MNKYNENSENMLNACSGDCNFNKLFEMLVATVNEAESIYDVNRDLRDIYVSYNDFINNSGDLIKCSVQFANILIIQEKFLGLCKSKKKLTVKTLRSLAIISGIRVEMSDNDNIFLLKMATSYLASEKVLEFLISQDYKLIYYNKFTSDTGMPNTQIREFAIRNTTKEFPVILVGDFIYNEKDSDINEKYNKKLNEILKNYNGNTHELYYNAHLPFLSYSNYFRDTMVYISNVYITNELVEEFYVLDTVIDPLLQFNTDKVIEVINKSEYSIQEFYKVIIDLIDFNKVNNLGVILGLFTPTTKTMNAYGHCEAFVISEDIGLFYDSTHDTLYRNASVIKAFGEAMGVKSWVINLNGPQKKGAYCCLYSFALIDAVKNRGGILSAFHEFYNESYSPKELPISDYICGKIKGSSDDTDTKVKYKIISQNVLNNSENVPGFNYF